MKKSLIVLVLGAAVLTSLQAGFTEGTGEVWSGPSPNDPTTTQEWLNALPIPGVGELEWIARRPAEGEGDGLDLVVDGLNEESGTASWDLTGTGWEMWAVTVKTGGTTRVYIVDEDQRFVGGPEVIQGGLVDSGAVGDISHVDFWGKTAVPDAGSMLSLLALGFFCLAGIGRLGFRAGTGQGKR